MVNCVAVGSSYTCRPNETAGNDNLRAHTAFRKCGGHLRGKHCGARAHPLFSFTAPPPTGCCCVCCTAASDKLLVHASSTESIAVLAWAANEAASHSEATTTPLSIFPVPDPTDVGRSRPRCTSRRESHTILRSHGVLRRLSRSDLRPVDFRIRIKITLERSSLSWALLHVQFYAVQRQCGFLRRTMV
eukprot:COSAG02_NODE_6719_length_3402_cov_9.452619_2_plen_188_part_00